MREIDWFSNVGRSADPEGAAPLDSIREYRAAAPGGFAYLQSRWLSGGLILNAGLRAEYYTPGREATRQTLPGSADGDQPQSSTVHRIGATPLRRRARRGRVGLRPQRGRTSTWGRTKADTGRGRYCQISLWLAGGPG
jgi:hypothetical protein